MAKPWFHGCRCTRDGGEWWFYRTRTGKAVVKEEFWAIVESDNQREQKMRQQEIVGLMRRAQEGNLDWHTHWRSGTVRDIERHNNLLELRWENRPFDDEIPPVLTRLYFAEPTEVEELLLALRFAPKDVHNPASQQQQDADIDQAQERFAAGRAWQWGKPN